MATAPTSNNTDPLIKQLTTRSTVLTTLSPQPQHTFIPDPLFAPVSPSTSSCGSEGSSASEHSRCYESSDVSRSSSITTSSLRQFDRDGINTCEPRDLKGAKELEKRENVDPTVKHKRSATRAELLREMDMARAKLGKEPFQSPFLNYWRAC